jgi:succinoglycan biosynthesis protein ExoO
MVADDCALVEDGAERPWGSLLATRHLRLERPAPVTAADFARLDLGLLKPLVRREFLTRHGLTFDPGLRYVHDFQQWLACLLHGARLVVVPEAHYVYRARPGALTEDKHPVLVELRDVVRAVLTRSDVRDDPALSAALRARLLRADREIEYQRFAGLLKRLVLGAAARQLARHPGVVGTGLRHLPLVLRARLSRRPGAAGLFPRAERNPRPSRGRT